MDEYTGQGIILPGDKKGGQHAFHHTTQNIIQILKLMKFISVIFHLFLDFHGK